MELTRGDVLVNLKSGKEYAVVYAGERVITAVKGVNYVGLRNGKSFGPIRAGVEATIAKNFGKTAKVATFDGPTGWRVIRVTHLYEPQEAK